MRRPTGLLPALLLPLGLTLSAPGQLLHAQDGPALRRGLSECLAHPDPRLRLECYDRLAGEVEGEAGLRWLDTSGGMMLGSWVVQEELDPMRDALTVTASLDAVLGSGPDGDPVTLRVRCQEGRTVVSIHWARFLGGERQMRLRFGSQEPFAVRWDRTPGGSALELSRDTPGFLARMAEHPRFAAQIAVTRGGEATAVWELAGLTEAMQPVREQCRW